MGQPLIARIEIDRDRCISSGRCVADEPSLFTFDDDELATVIGSAVEHTADRLIRLARNCPGEAITLVDADGEVVSLD